VKINENYKVDDLMDMVEVVADLTDINDNNNAYATIAQFFRMKKYVDIFDHIMEIQHIEGYMPEGLNTYRYTLYKEMMEIIRKHEGKEVYDLVYGAT